MNGSITNAKMLHQHILQKHPQVASRTPGVELPVSGAQELTPPDAVEPGRLHRIDPFLKRDATSARPYIAAALRAVASRAEFVERITEIDAENRLPVHPGDFLGLGAAVPEVIEVEHEADFIASRFFEQLELLIEPIDRRESNRFEIEPDRVR